MSSSKDIRFVPIINVICACGNETGLYQAEIEFRLQDTIPGFKADSKDVSKILDNLEIKKLCCRRTLLAVPVYQVVSADIGVVRYRREKGDIIEDRDELIIHPLLI